ncbi:MAG: hypothetical protein IKS52_11520 [Clostridia bacterium]|nr:hypothetical protein [Clostridia bacterium]
MTRSGQARKFARKTLKKTGGATRRVMCVQMVLYTLIIAAATAAVELDSRKIIQLDAISPWLMKLLFPCALFLLALVNLLINVPLTAIARKSSDGAFSRMNFGRVLIAILLALLPAAALYGIMQLADLANNQWQVILNWALANNTNIILSCAAAAAGLLVILYVCGVIGVFSRQLMLYMADCPDRMKGASVGQIVRNGFAHAFAPVLLVLRSLFWFLLLLIIVAALVVAACFITSTITLDAPLDMVLLQITAAITAPLPAWAIGSIIVLGVVWVLGLGLVFWPRFSMMRLYYHRLIMRDTDVM